MPTPTPKPAPTQDYVSRKSFVLGLLATIRLEGIVSLSVEHDRWDSSLYDAVQRAKERKLLGAPRFSLSPQEVRNYIFESGAPVIKDGHYCLPCKKVAEAHLSSLTQATGATREDMIPIVNSFLESFN